MQVGRQPKNQPIAEKHVIFDVCAQKRRALRKNFILA